MSTVGQFDLPPDLPVPVDDGAAAHLTGALLPAIALPSTHGGAVDLSALDRAVVFMYPRTGVPGEPTGDAWDAIPGARGCTPQCCGFRDLKGEFDRLGVAVVALSTQTTAYQQAFADRMHFPFAMLSDAELRLTRAMRLPTFEYDEAAFGTSREWGIGGATTLIKRMAWYVERGRIVKVWYPVFPPDRNAEEVVGWVGERAGGTRI